MKKIFICAFLTLAFVATSCMEKERPHQQKEVPVTPQQIIPISQVSEDQWRTLNNLMDSHYISSQPMTLYSDMSPTLMTIYKQSTRQEETKPLLRTNPSRPIDEIKKELHDKAYNFIYDEIRNKQLNQNKQGKTLAHIIDDINKAKSQAIHAEGIDGESLSRYTFIRKENYADKKLIDDIDHAGNIVPLFFILLHKYITTISQTKEEIPFINVNKKDLNDILDRPSQQKTYGSKVDNLYKDLSEFSAFIQLQYVIREMVQNYHSANINMFMTCLYKDPTRLRAYPSRPDEDVKHKLYQQVYNWVSYCDISADQLFDLLKIIDDAKSKQKNISETDIGYQILASDPTESWSQLYGKWTNEKYAPINIKNRVALLCKLIKQYNDARCTKTTPTPNQCEAYVLKTFFDIPLPESFSYPSFFNEKEYAFEEFRRFIGDVKILFDTKNTEIQKQNTEIQKQADKHYPSKK